MKSQHLFVLLLCFVSLMSTVYGNNETRREDGNPIVNPDKKSDGGGVEQLVNVAFWAVVGGAILLGCYIVLRRVL